MMRRAIIVAVSFIACAVAWSGDDFTYEVRGRRDPFIPLVGPGTRLKASLKDVTSIDEIQVEGIAVGLHGKSVVIINGEMLKEGDIIGSLEIRKISKTVVTLSIGGKEHTVTLSEEGGVKREK